MDITIYTDGSCSPNPGKGGWGYVILPGGQVIEEMYGGEEKSTNNIMEMIAVLEALKSINRFKKITIYSDSQYVINCAQKLWKRKMNIELWEKFDELSKDKTITWNWVKGHAGDKYNEIVDKLAKKGRAE